MFHNVFSKRATGFHKQAKIAIQIELLYNKNFPLDSQVVLAASQFAQCLAIKITKTPAKHKIIIYLYHSQRVVLQYSKSDDFMLQKLKVDA